eukprot:3594181-Pyramimonas_sp.AAC.1
MRRPAPPTIIAPIVHAPPPRAHFPLRRGHFPLRPGGGRRNQNMPSFPFHHHVRGRRRHGGRGSHA